PADGSSKPSSAGAAGSMPLRFRNSRSSPSVTAPGNSSTGWPFTSRNTVGTDRIWNAAASCCSLSTSTLASSNAPLYSPASFSRIGPRVLQGPHHSAQKSISTGVVVDFWRTSDSKLAAVASKTWAGGWLLIGGRFLFRCPKHGAGPGGIQAAPRFTRAWPRVQCPAVPAGCGCEDGWLAKNRSGPGRRPVRLGRGRRLRGRGGDWRRDAGRLLAPAPPAGAAGSRRRARGTRVQCGGLRAVRPACRGGGAGDVPAAATRERVVATHWSAHGAFIGPGLRRPGPVPARPAGPGRAGQRAACQRLAGVVDRIRRRCAVAGRRPATGADGDHGGGPAVTGHDAGPPGLDRARAGAADRIRRVAGLAGACALAGRRGRLSRGGS